MTYTELYINWYQCKKRMVKESSMAAYALIDRSHLRPAFADMDVTAIRKKDIQAFIYSKLDCGLSVKYVQDMLIVLKMVLRYAAEEYDLAVLTSWKLEWPSRNKGSAPKLERYTAEETRRIIECALAKPAPAKTGILLGLFAGMRIGEICALQFRDIDFDKKTVSVRRTIQRVYMLEPEKSSIAGSTRMTISEPKTKNSQREIPLSREIVPLLKAYSHIAAPEYYVATLSEHPAEPRTYRNAYRRFILDEVGLDHCIKFHGLRHTFASTLIDNKVDVKTVSALLGHSDVSTTLNVYVHPSEESKRAAVGTIFKRKKK